MPYILVRHKSEDFARWKPVYDGHAATRKAAGCKGARLFRSSTNPSETIVLLEWDDLNKARQFAQSPDLRETMKRAGVVGQPDIYFLEEVEHTGA